MKIFTITHITKTWQVVSRSAAGESCERAVRHPRIKRYDDPSMRRSGAVIITRCEGWGYERSFSFRRCRAWNESAAVVHVVLYSTWGDGRDDIAWRGLYILSQCRCLAFFAFLRLAYSYICIFSIISMKKLYTLNTKVEKWTPKSRKWLISTFEK